MGFNFKVVEPGKPIEGAQETRLRNLARRPRANVRARARRSEGRDYLGRGGHGVEADLVAADEQKDLAVLKPRTALSSDLKPLAFGSERQVQHRGGCGDHWLSARQRARKQRALYLGIDQRRQRPQGRSPATAGFGSDPARQQRRAAVRPCDGVVIGVIQKTLNPVRMMEQAGGALASRTSTSRSRALSYSTYLKSSNDALYRTLLSSTVGSSVEELQSPALPASRPALSPRNSKRNRSSSRASTM